MTPGPTGIRRQPLFPGSMPFPCKNMTSPGLGRSTVRPTSVHRLRPGDIDVVGAMGDSLVAGNGALEEFAMGTLIEYRGVSWAAGTAYILFEYNGYIIYFLLVFDALTTHYMAISILVRLVLSITRVYYYVECCHKNPGGHPSWCYRRNGRGSTAAHISDHSYTIQISYCNFKFVYVYTYMYSVYNIILLILYSDFLSVTVQFLYAWITCFFDAFHCNYSIRPSSNQLIN